MTTDMWTRAAREVLSGLFPTEPLLRAFIGTFFLPLHERLSPTLSHGQLATGLIESVDPDGLLAALRSGLPRELTQKAGLDIAHALKYLNIAELGSEAVIKTLAVVGSGKDPTLLAALAAVSELAFTELDDVDVTSLLKQLAAWLEVENRRRGTFSNSRQSTPQYLRDWPILILAWLAITRLCRFGPAHAAEPLAACVMNLIHLILPLGSKSESTPDFSTQAVPLVKSLLDCQTNPAVAGQLSILLAQLFVHFDRIDEALVLSEFQRHGKGLTAIEHQLIHWWCLLAQERRQEADGVLHEILAALGSEADSHSLAYRDVALRVLLTIGSEFTLESAKIWGLAKQVFGEEGLGYIYYRLATSKMASITGSAGSLPDSEQRLRNVCTLLYTAQSAYERTPNLLMVNRVALRLLEAKFRLYSWQGNPSPAELELEFNRLVQSFAVGGETHDEQFLGAVLLLRGQWSLRNLGDSPLHILPGHQQALCDLGDAVKAFRKANNPGDAARAELALTRARISRAEKASSQETRLRLYQEASVGLRARISWPDGLHAEANRLAARISDVLFRGQHEHRLSALFQVSQSSAASQTDRRSALTDLLSYLVEVAPEDASQRALLSDWVVHFCDAANLCAAEWNDYGLALLTFDPVALVAEDGLIHKDYVATVLAHLRKEPLPD